jgi:hypothetical protein
MLFRSSVRVSGRVLNAQRDKTANLQNTKLTIDCHVVSGARIDEATPAVHDMLHEYAHPHTHTHTHTHTRRSIFAKVLNVGTFLYAEQIFLYQINIQVVSF